MVPPQVPLKLILVRVGEHPADIAREEASTSHLLRAGCLGEVKLLVLEENHTNQQLNRVKFSKSRIGWKYLVCET